MLENILNPFKTAGTDLRTIYNNSWSSGWGEKIQEYEYVKKYEPWKLRSPLKNLLEDRSGYDEATGRNNYFRDKQKKEKENEIEGFIILGVLLMAVSLIINIFK